MELRTFVAILWRRKWIIAIATVVTIMVATVGTLMLSPVYAATATLHIATTADGTYRSGQTIYADRLKKTYATIATSDPFVKEVEQKLGLEQEPDINVTALANTELLEVTAEYGHPFVAAEIANTVAEMIVVESLSSPQMQANPVQLSFPATEPIDPTKPNKKLNIALSAMVGLAAGLGLAFLIESVDTTLYTTEQIEDVTALSVLGKVPRFTKQSHVLGKDDHFYVVDEGEAYRRIRTNVFALKYVDHLQTLLVTSAMPGEGKSTVVSNLGYVMAQSGKSVIVVDSDLRRPALHKIFNLPNDNGLSNILQDESTLEEAIQEVDGSQLHVLTSGPLSRNPSELMASNQMATLLTKVAKLYEVILIDTPALSAVSDAAVLAPAVDGVLLVVALAQVRQETVEATQQQLATVNMKPLGVIVNRSERNQSYGRYEVPMVKVP
jgi:succinoglycan biosynthesis transport protein ExoP